MNNNYPLIHENDFFIIEACMEPHVSRTDGGHIIIFPKIPVTNRWDLNSQQAISLMRLSMITGEAMKEALNEQGIPVERINFQDNGNWGLKSPYGPKMHLHLYGRAKNSVNQIHGEALVFPKQETKFWENLNPLTKEDCQIIKKYFISISMNERYDMKFWK